MDSLVKNDECGIVCLVQNGKWGGVFPSPLHKQ